MNPRLKPIPSRHSNGMMKAEEKRQAHQFMVQDGLAGLDFIDVLNAIEAHLEARPDQDPVKLEQFANRIGRRAHMRARS